MPTGDSTGPVVVIGAGLGGSLLTLALAETAPDVATVLVDPLARPTGGRAWAFFEPDDDVVDHGPGTRRFRELRVAGPRGEQRLVLRHHSYTVLSGDDLADRTDAALLGRGTRRRGVATARDGEHGPVRVNGETPAGDLVVDSVGLSRAARAPQAWLHFTGCHVHAERAAFDPSTVTLMDFCVPQRGDLRFVYVLPASEHDALVELTAFSSSPEPPSAVEQDLAGYLDATVGIGTWQARSCESGTLPLDPRIHRRRSPTRAGSGRGTAVVRIGSAAGMVKASTGYGVRLMQRDARALADDIARGRRPRGLRRRARHRWLDSVFLRLAVSDPDRLRDALEQMFAANPVDKVVAFLDEELSVLDEARVIARMPFRPFLRAALSPVRRPHASGLASDGCVEAAKPAAAVARSRS